jgi:general nucleoside transport system permease protein
MDAITWIIGVVTRGLAVGTPLLWGVLGEIYAERAGVVNLGVEGMMILGAFFAFATAQLTGQPALGLIVAAVVGGLAAVLHAFVSVTLRANQYVSGLALTMFGLGLSGLLGRGYEGIPLAHPLPEFSAVLPLGLALAVILWGLLRHTRWGIALRTTGEMPAAADAMGVNVALVRYLAVIFGGVMAGAGGGFLSVAYRPAWTEGMTGGIGWIVVALAIFAGWDPLRAILASFFFGTLFHLSFRLQAWVAPEALQMMPFAFTIIVLAVTARRAARVWQPPEALGLPYVRGER